MSELTNAAGNANFCRRLLESVSILALLGVAGSPRGAEAADAPLVWIELDGQFNQQVSGGSAFDPPFLANSPFDKSTGALQKGSATDWDRGLNIDFQPDGSDWMISGSVRYGKSGKSEHFSRLAPQPTAASSEYYHAYQKFDSESSDNHAIVDFKVGRDFGLGGFERSVINLGVRYAQFKARRNVAIRSQPTNQPEGHYPYSRFYGAFSVARKFSGIGPSLSWDASLHIAGNHENSDVALDWGLNGALLFGRQKADGSHQTTNIYRTYTFNYIHDHVHYQNTIPVKRNRNTTVPNIGGFAAISFRYSNAKIAFGYRADTFFNAIDGGIDTRKSENVGFYGPFATISVGLGG